MTMLRTTCIALVLVLANLPGLARADDPAAIVKGFIDAWATHDVDRIMSFVADDCYYENVPSLSGPEGSMKGKDKMRAFLAPFFAKEPLVVPFKFHTEITNTIVSTDGMALERTDYFEIAGAKYSARVAALFKVKNGKISYWIDYFDGNAFAPISTLMGALAKK